MSDFDDPESSEDCLRRVAEIIREQLTPESPPTELELAEQQAQAEGWGPEFRAALDRQRLEEEEEQERQQERARKRKRELDSQAELLAAKAEGLQREHEKERMFASDEVEQRRHAEREENSKVMMTCLFPDEEC